MLHHRKLTILFAAAYCLATTTAAVFHTHGVGDCGSCPAPVADAVAGRAVAPCCCHIDHAEPNLPEQPPLGHRRASEKQCPVCRFLAFKPIPADTVEEITSASLHLLLIRPSARPPVNTAPWTWHCRAPPAAA